MRINSIKITNFRGFENREFAFDPQMNVVIGDNGSGKTSLLRAVGVALGAYLKSLRTLPNDKSFRKNFTPSDVYRSYDGKGKGYLFNADRTRVEVDADLFLTQRNGEAYYNEPKSVKWSRELRGNVTTHSKECVSDIIQFAESLESARTSSDSQINAIFPVIRSFGSSRIDESYRTSNKGSTREPRLAKAYRSALKDTIDFKSAYDWLYRYDSALNKGWEFKGTREALLNAQYVAIPCLSDIVVDTKNNEFVAKVSLPGQPPVYQALEDMSDSLKSLICMVGDIAYRCIQLNGFLGEDAVKETPGVVLIDNIELYLHPRWQKHILSCLMTAFPKIQFIVTTYSPFIIQSVPSKNIIALDGNPGNTDPCKRSIEEIALAEMGVDTPRSERFNLMVQTAEEYYQLIKQSQGNTEKAKDVKRRLDEIEGEFSDDPAYVALLKIERKAESFEPQSFES